MVKHKPYHIIMEDGAECKKCTCCLRLKPISEFSKESKHSDGLKSECKACLSRKAKEIRRRRYFQK